MNRRFKDLIAVQSVRRTILLLSVIVLTAVAGCSNEEPAGTPEKVGDFTLQKFTNWYGTPNGSRSTMNYTKMTYGHLFKRDVVFPELWKNKNFDRVTRLPSAEPAWIIEVGKESALVTQKRGDLLVQLLLTDNMRGARGSIERVDSARWHIPAYPYVGDYPNRRSRGGRLFNGNALTQHWLPLQPMGSGQMVYAVEFLGVSPDETAAAWLWDIRLSHGQRLEFSVAVGDDQMPEAVPLPLDEAAMTSSPHESLIQSSWIEWFAAHYTWQRSATGRWEVVRR